MRKLTVGHSWLTVHIQTLNSRKGSKQEVHQFISLINLSRKIPGISFPTFSQFVDWILEDVKQGRTLVRSFGTRHVHITQPMTFLRRS